MCLSWNLWGEVVEVGENKSKVQREGELTDERMQHRQGVEQKDKNNVWFEDQGDDAKQCHCLLQWYAPKI